MRVVHLTTLHPALDVRIFQKECRTLAASGYEVHLLAKNPPTEAMDGVTFHALGDFTEKSHATRIRERLDDAYERAAALRADVYHFHDAELVTVARRLKRSGARIIYDVHEDSPQEALSLNRHRPLYAFAKYLAFRWLRHQSRGFVDWFVTATPKIASYFPADRTTVVHNYPRLEEYGGVLGERPTAKSSPPRFVFTGVITEIRGAKQMVQALDCLSEDLDARLQLIGDFHPPALREELCRLPGWGRVEHLPWQSRESLVRHLAVAAAGLVLFQPDPNHVMALPNKMFEYMAAGVPVIASDFPSWREMIDSHECGLTANPRDPASIARAMARLLRDPWAAMEMGVRGAAAVKSTYHWDSEGEKLLAVYRGIASPPG